MRIFRGALAAHATLQKPSKPASILKRLWGRLVACGRLVIGPPLQGGRPLRPQIPPQETLPQESSASCPSISQRRTLLIACGNPLRCDDGVAPEVLQRMAPAADREFRSVHQLTPECAQEISGFERVIFLDADAAATDGTTHPTIEAVPAVTYRSPLTHACTPAEIVALSKALYSFTGEAIVCRIPARDFSPAHGLSPNGLTLVREAAIELEHFL